MSTLLLRFAAPLQSWGNDSKYDTRRTQREPTKSGVIGLLASALGRKRNEDISDLAGLRLAVRTDKQGKLLRDYQIARKMKDRNKLDTSYVTNRYYLSDAVFLVGLESDDRDLLNSLEDALHYPGFPLFLGRRSCPPQGKVCLGIIDDKLETVMREYPLLVEKKSASYPIQIMIDSDDERKGIPVGDNPLSFNPMHRKFSYRLAEKHYLQREYEEEHDPMKELR